MHPSEPGEWTRTALERQGFEGWVTFEALEKGLPRLSQQGGVYLVTQAVGAAVSFLGANPAGRFKGKDPTMPRAALDANWVETAEVVYIGKANNLRRRLRQFMRFGSGVPVGHWGGRLIWQLGASNELLVAWRETPDENPREVETAMLARFRTAYGKPPFANEPQHMGS